MDKEEIKKTERLFELLKQKGTLRSFDDKRKNIKAKSDLKSPEEIIAEHMRAKEDKVPTVQELVNKKKKEI